MEPDFSLNALEYPRLISLLGRYVRSELGRARLEELRPTSDRAFLDSRHALNGEAMNYLREGRVVFSELGLLPGLLPRLGLPGITLEIAEVESVQDFLGEVLGLKARWKAAARDYPLLAERSSRFPDLGRLATLLGRAVRAGEINEDFSPDLKRIRGELERARQRLNRKLESLLKDPHVADRLQDQLVTMRNGRYVIPVRVEQKRSVDGIVHGTSSSGATVFMEPLDTLEMNNDLVRLGEEEEREVRRILGELTDRICESVEDLRVAAVLWADLEVRFGIAQFGRDFDCTSPEFSDGAMVLSQARHPLLDDRLRQSPDSGTGMIPLDLELGRDETILVISGPNAGGKTVVLKTIGLLSLMAQSGLPVPAARAVLRMSDRILADIGDQQSIVNQLSTFSAHVLSISEMVARASDRSMILLDEIGSSTEPSEGAALGIAVLDHFRAVGSRTVATTHYNRLKMYAETTPQVRNAAMEFDESTLEPTYRLIHGLAGQSSGLRIAERLKMPGKLIAVARQALDRTELDAARYVDELKVRVAGLEAEKDRLEAERESFERWKRETSQRLAAERADELVRLDRRLDGIIADIRKHASEALKSLGSEAVNRFDKRMKRVRSEAGTAIRREEVRTPGPVPPPKPAGRLASAESIREGSRVRILSLGLEGAVAHVSNLEVEVTVGNMKMRRPFSDLEPVDAPSLALPKNVRFEFGEKRLESNQINLIGRNAEEARDELDKFLDDAFLARLTMVRIVHGHGMGVLRRAVGEVLEVHPHIERFEPAPPSQGGTGATLAFLRD